MRGGRAAEVAATLILVLGTALGFAAAGLPTVVPASAPADVPSAERARQDLQAITATPHALGSVEHDRLRDYLVDRLRALGCDDVHVQYATGFDMRAGPIAATVANVIARKHGTLGGPAIVLSAHYDAVPRSFGAGDDGAGVAAILETLRALASSPPLQRDLIILFTDAEEEGLLGAEAFVSLHPWAKDVGVVLNFEGRGNAGPVYMFQTSPGNAPLIDALAQVAGARTNSLTGEVYRQLPSDTDLGIWLHSPLAIGALNFAHVDGYPHYHTPIDNLASLDPRVVQQMADYAFSLTRTLGTTDLTRLRTHDATYFNAPLVGVVHYPASGDLSVAVSELALVLLLIGLGRYRHTLTLRGLGRGAVALFVTLSLPVLVTLAAWYAIRLAHPGYREILQGDPYNSRAYLLAVAAFTLAVAVGVQRWVAARATAPEVAIAPMVLFGIAGVVVARLLPGASYLFCWPLLAALVCTTWWQWAEARGHTPPAWLALCALPALVLWPPLVTALEVALTAAMLPLSALLLALILSLVTMPLQLVGALRRWIMIGALAISGSALIWAEVHAPFNVERKRPDSLSYFVAADSMKAWWITFDHAPDRWTRRVLGAQPSRHDFAGYGFARRAGATMATPAERPMVPPSPVTVLADQSTPDGRRVHLHVARSGTGEFVAMYADSSIAISRMAINGRSLPDGDGTDRYASRYHVGTDGTVLRYFGVPEEGVDLWFTVGGDEHVTVRVVTATEGLPPISPRPPDLMSKPFVPTDMTIFGWAVRL